MSFVDGIWYGEKLFVKYMFHKTSKNPKIFTFPRSDFYEALI